MNTTVCTGGRDEYRLFAQLIKQILAQVELEWSIFLACDLTYCTLRYTSLTRKVLDVLIGSRGIVDISDTTEHGRLPAVEIVEFLHRTQQSVKPTVLLHVDNNIVFGVDTSSRYSIR